MFELCQKLKRCVLIWHFIHMYYCTQCVVYFKHTNTWLKRCVWDSVVRYSKLYHKKVWPIGVKLLKRKVAQVQRGGLCPLVSHVEILFSTLQRDLLIESAEFCSTSWFLSLLQAAISLFVTKCSHHQKSIHQNIDNIFLFQNSVYVSA